MGVRRKRFRRANMHGRKTKSEGTKGSISRDMLLWCSTTRRNNTTGALLPYIWQWWKSCIAPLMQVPAPLKQLHEKHFRFSAIDDDHGKPAWCNLTASQNGFVASSHLLAQQRRCHWPKGCTLQIGKTKINVMQLLLSENPFGILFIFIEQAKRQASWKIFSIFTYTWYSQCVLDCFGFVLISSTKYTNPLNKSQ